MILFPAFLRSNLQALSLLLIPCLIFNSCSQGYDEKSPEAELATFQFADPNLRITLIASEPDVQSPVAMAWSPDGFLYVAEMPGYPTTEYTGIIKKLHDPDGDGLFEMASIFSQDLNFPNSIMCYDGGILVTDAPDIVFLKDSDQDGVADIRRVVLSGFEPGNEQLRANGLYWGLDNWIYGANGRSGGSVYFPSDSNNRISIHNRDFRFRLDSQEFQAISGMSQYGLAHDDWGNRFISYNHRFARQVVLEERHLLNNPSLAVHAVFDTYQSEHDRRVYTLLDEAIRFNRDPIGYFTSLSGLTVYRGELLGTEYNGDLFAGESVQAAVISRRMETDGPVFKAANLQPESEFLASPDSWFHPVNFANGPDGALYMVDFYRMLVEHPEWAHEDKKEGVEWEKGQEYGRIWRISHKDHPWDPEMMITDLHQASTEQLVSQLTETSGWRRDMAQQLLVNQKRTDAGVLLEPLLVHDQSVTRLKALWTLQGLGLLTNSQVEQALTDGDPRVLVQAIKLAEARVDQSQGIIDQLTKLATSDQGLVRFHAILALGWSDQQVARQALLISGKLYHDHWTRVALLGSVSKWADTFTQTLLADTEERLMGNSEDVSFYRQLGSLVAASSETTQNSNWMRQLTRGRMLSRIEIAFLVGFMDAAHASGKSVSDISNKFYEKMVQVASDGTDSLRAQLAVELLGYAGSGKVHQELVQIVLDSPSDQIKITGLNTVALLNDLKISNSLYENLSSLDPDVRKHLIASSLGSDAAAQALLTAIEDEKVDATEVPEELRHALLAHSNQSIKDTAASILGASVDADRQKVVDLYLASLSSQTVDLKNGAVIFRDQCSVCHAVNGEGGLLGPDLTNIGNRSDEVLMVSILDPSRMVSYELTLHVVETVSGEIYSGTISAETATSITIRQPDGKEHTILRENIKEDIGTRQSIMPEGFERMINQNEMADLIGFLRAPVPIN